MCARSNMASKDARRLPLYLKMKLNKVMLNYAIQPWRFRNFKAKNYGRCEVTVPPIREKRWGYERTLITEKKKPIKLYENPDELQKLYMEKYPENLRMNLLNLLDQMDIYERRKRIKIPEFCVGSIVRVEYYAHSKTGNFETFTGLCVRKSNKTQTIGHMFSLFNAYNDINVKMQFFIYDVKMKSIEVLRHTSMTFDQINALKQLPPKFNNHSLLDHIPYTEKPVLFKFSPQDEQAIRNFLDNKIINIRMRERSKERNVRKERNDTSFTHPKPHWINLK